MYSQNYLYLRCSVYTASIVWLGLACDPYATKDIDPKQLTKLVDFLSGAGDIAHSFMDLL
jgi:hypothetical protein